ncbi:hypothetical protein [Pseudoxanthomonas winnipegensis]|nr:hypothetical protein [Pseudoxanthomonas winnipegensis]
MSSGILPARIPYRSKRRAAVTAGRARILGFAPEYKNAPQSG